MKFQCLNQKNLNGAISRTEKSGCAYMISPLKNTCQTCSLFSPTGKVKVKISGCLMLTLVCSRVKTSMSEQIQLPQRRAKLIKPETYTYYSNLFCTPRIQQIISNSRSHVCGDQFLLGFLTKPLSKKYFLRVGVLLQRPQWTTLKSTNLKKGSNSLRR